MFRAGIRRRHHRRQCQGRFARGSLIGTEQFADTKIEQLRLARFGDQDIGWLDVAMNNQMLVCIMNCRADFAKELEAGLKGKAFLVAVIVDANPIDVFHREKWTAVRQDAAAVELGDVWMIKTGEETLLPLEAADD